MADLSWLSRSALLVETKGLEIHPQKNGLIIGLRGVGSFAAGFICRNGIGEMTIVDGDAVEPPNRNRQMPALTINHGLTNADIMAKRLKAINLALKLNVIKEFLTSGKCREIMRPHYDYTVDCIDSVTLKITLLSKALENNFQIASSMRAGGKVDPTKLCVSYLPETYQCVFARRIRKQIKKQANYQKVKVVFSTKKIIKESLTMTDGSNFKRSAYGAVSYLPAAFRGVCASVVIRDLFGIKIKMEKQPGHRDTKTQKKHNL